jgi:hypothetical protein
MKNKYYVYAYLNPLKSGKYLYDGYKFDYEPFYIGKGCNYRAKSIKGHFKNKELKIFIQSLKIKPVIEYIKKDMNEYDSFLLEGRLINLIGRKNIKNGPLLNVISENTTSNVFTDEVKKKMSLNRTGEKNSNAKLYKISTFDGGVFIIKSLSTFCKLHDFNLTTVQSAMKQKRWYHGYLFKCLEPKDEYFTYNVEKPQILYKITEGDKKPYIVSNLKELLPKSNLTKSTFYRAIRNNGKINNIVVEKINIKSEV